MPHGAEGRAVHLIERWVAAVARRAWLVLAGVALLTAACLVYTLEHFSVNTDTAEMISADVPYRVTEAALARAFPDSTDNFVIVVDGRTPEAAEAASAAIRDRLAADPTVIEGVLWPEGHPFFRQNGLLYLDAPALEEMTERLLSARPFLGALANDPSLRGLLALLDQALGAVAGDPSRLPAGTEIEQLMNGVADVIEARVAGSPQPLSWRSLFPVSEGEPGTLRQLLLAKPVLDFRTLAPAEAAVARVRQAIAEIPPPIADDVTVRITGGPMLDYEEVASAAEGAGLAAIISLALVAAILVWGLGSAWLALSVFATLLVGLVWTATFGVVAIGEFNLISVTFAVLFVGLAVDFAIHFALRYREQIDLGQDRWAAFPRTARGVGPALTFLAVAIAAAFLAFVPTAYVGLSELGLIAGAGMFIALAATITVLPALLALRPLPPLHRQPPRTALNLESWLRRHAAAVATGAAVLAIAAASLLPLLSFDEDPLNLKDPETESVQTVRDLSARDQITLYPAEAMTDSLDAAVALADRATALPGVEDAVTLMTLVPEEQEEKLAIVEGAAQRMLPALPDGMQTPALDAAALRPILESGATRLAQSPSEAAGRLARALERLAEAPDSTVVGANDDSFLHFPGLIDRLRDALGAGPVTIDDLPPPLRSRWLAADGRARVEIIASADVDRDAEARRRFVGQVRELDPMMAGPAVGTVEAGRAVTNAMLQATFYALAALTVLVLVALRSAADLLLALLPVIFAGLGAAATAVLAGVPLNFANVIVLPLIFGIGLAGCGQLLMRARIEPLDSALFATVTPLATVLSMMTTVGAFGSLMVSSHRGTQSMGILLVIAISWTLVATLVVLVALIELKHRRLRRRAGSAGNPPH